MSNQYRFQDQTFQIDHYDKQKTFASFLPGLAGKRGIPLWAFYVNRGQGISSFGIRDKNGAIMEFYPANLAYLYNSKIGFRTFIKSSGVVHEVFQPEKTPHSRQMHIRQSEFSIVEENHDLGLEIRVTYFGLPEEPIAALVRHVEIKNITKHAKSFEILDGISQILPSGIEYGGYKAISNLLRSWMDVDNLDVHVPFYKLRSSTGDEAETKEFKDGNFYVSIVDGKRVKPIVDQDLVFGMDTALNHASHFSSHSVKQISESPQYTANKVPCGFSPLSTHILGGETKVIDTLIGYGSDLALINQFAEKLSHEFFEAKRLQARQLIDDLLVDVELETNIPIFDEYVRQSYLDNFLRGGYPFIIPTKNKPFVYYLYSRKHGDLERDYNFFSIAPEFYSQGNGNFRDVCQNRRNDVLIHPESQDYSVKVFASLIQADGYNPLSINGATFELNDPQQADALAKQLFPTHQAQMSALLKGKFTPGSIINTLANQNIPTPLSDDALLSEIFSHAKQNIEASHGEGYWIDHWTYILDLVENYLKIFPDQEQAFLFEEASILTFESPVTVFPRSEKTVLDQAGHVRQYGSLRHPDREKISRLQLKEHGTNWLKDSHGRILQTTLYSKLVLLAMNKFALLDPECMGIEMEANKPGWNDAMNGLPGLFASGVSETIELARLIDFLQNHHSNQAVLTLPVEFLTFLERIQAIDYQDAYHAHLALAKAREEYREAIRFGSKGQHTISDAAIRAFYPKAKAILDQGIQKAITLGNGIIPTYLTYEAKEYQVLQDANGQSIKTHYGLPAVEVHSFTVKALPAFLEAPARLFKYTKDETLVRHMAQKIKQSGVYDAALKMYKTSDDLDEYGYEIGRIRAFTKGWLEREANFLHMTYKYLLGLLKSGQYDLFYEEAKDNFVCFMDPEVYGRSTLENSSFIATSNNPNPMVHGQGFVSRLSGSTAEMLSMAHMMIFGKQLYSVANGSLQLKLAPSVPKEYFKDGILKAKFHGVDIIFQNPNNQDSYLLKPTCYVLKKEGHILDTINSQQIPEPYSKQIRNREIDQVIVNLG